MKSSPGTRRSSRTTTPSMGAPEEMTPSRVVLTRMPPPREGLTRAAPATRRTRTEVASARRASVVSNRASSAPRGGLRAGRGRTRPGWSFTVASGRNGSRCPPEMTRRRTLSSGSGGSGSTRPASRFGLTCSGGRRPRPSTGPRLAVTRTATWMPGRPTSWPAHLRYGAVQASLETVGERDLQHGGGSLQPARVKCELEGPSPDHPDRLEDPVPDLKAAVGDGEQGLARRLQPPIDPDGPDLAARPRLYSPRPPKCSSRGSRTWARAESEAASVSRACAAASASSRAR